MKEIKTKSTIKNIKALDKTADVSRRAKNAFIRTKEHTGQIQRPDDNSCAEYAEDKVKEGAKIGARETGNAVGYQGKKAVQKIKGRPKDADNNYAGTANEYTGEQTSSTETGNSQTDSRNAASSKGKQTGSSNAEKTPGQHNSPTHANQTAHPKDAQSKAGQMAEHNVMQSKAKETAKQEFTPLSKPKEAAKRSFLQNRAKQPLSQTGETGKANQIIGQRHSKQISRRIPAQSSIYQPAKKAATKTLHTGKTGRTMKRFAKTSGKTLKKTTKGTVKASQKSVKTAEKTAKATIKTSKTAAKAAVKTAQNLRNARRMAQAARAAARAAAVSAKAALKAMIAAIKAIIAATKGFTALIAAGGWTAVVVILVICLAGFLSGSVFGIFFSNESPGKNTTVISEVVKQLNEEFTEKPGQIQDENPHDTLEMSDNIRSPVANWRDILAVYAVRVAADPKDGMDVVSLDNTKVRILRDTFWDMNKINYWKETIEHVETITTVDKDGNETEETVTTTEIILHINLASKSSEDMVDEYNFNTEQAKLLDELMQDEYQELFMRLIGN